MITGKDDQRIELSKQSLHNFQSQDYSNKLLVIINHHPTRDVLVLSKQISNNITVDKNVCEIKVDKNGKTLGELRNFSLSLVPEGALWTTWDDDDWRHPTYLSVLYKRMTDTLTDCVAFTNRYEYNLNTKFAWKMTLMTGFPIILCKKHINIHYKNVDTMEDTELLQQIRELSYKITVFSNTPDMYIRIVHDNNTSKYVDPDKTSIRQTTGIYNEYNVSNIEKQYILQKINGYIKTASASESRRLLAAPDRVVSDAAGPNQGSI